MEATNSSYSYMSSIERISEILSATDSEFEEKDSLPSRNSLTHKNGFYANCTCIYIDIRNSSDLTALYLRPTIARIYRSFISECVAVINSCPECREVNIHGDAVWGVMETPYKTNIDDTFLTVAKLSSMVDILNVLLKRIKNIDAISVGIGMDYGRALMIKAGHKGSTINDIVWMGDVVNSASKLSSYGSRSWSDQRVMVSSVVHENLNDHNKSLLKYNVSRSCYSGSIIENTMNAWVIGNS